MGQGSALALKIDVSPGSAQAGRTLRLALLFVLVLLVVNAVFIPETFQFDFWALSDQGANLTVQYLIAQGLKPAIDFGYHYGLLPLLLGRIWFSLAGSTVVSCWILMTILALLVVVGLALFASALSLSTAGIVLLCVAIPHGVLYDFPNLAHGLEAALLANGLAEQAAGRRDRALAYATAACFAKPSMGYVYGLLILCIEVRNLWRERRLQPRAIAAFLRPAAFTALGLVLILSVVYGPTVFLQTILPISGAHEYRVLNFGFLRKGRNFWHPPGARLGYYAGTVAGFWIAGTLWLIACAAVTARNVGGEAETPAAARAREMIVSCALLHVASIAVLWGNAFSWFFYFYMLAMGIAATALLSPLANTAVYALVVVAMVGLKGTATSLHRLWTTTASSAETAGLWAPRAERDEWSHALGIISAAGPGGGPAVLLDETGCAELEFPVLAKPVTLFLWPGLANDAEVRRKQAQLAGARWVVVPVEQPFYEGFPADFPELESTLTHFFLAWAGRYFAVYERSDFAT